MSEMYELIVVGGGFIRCRDCRKVESEDPELSGGPCGKQEQTPAQCLDASGGGSLQNSIRRWTGCTPPLPETRGLGFGSQCDASAARQDVWELFRAEIIWAYVRVPSR